MNRHPAPLGTKFREGGAKFLDVDARWGHIANGGNDNLTRSPRSVAEASDFVARLEPGDTASETLGRHVSNPKPLSGNDRSFHELGRMAPAGGGQISDEVDGDFADASMSPPSIPAAVPNPLSNAASETVTEIVRLANRGRERGAACRRPGRAA